MNWQKSVVSEYATVTVEAVKLQTMGSYICDSIKLKHGRHNFIHLWSQYVGMPTEVIWWGRTISVEEHDQAQQTEFPVPKKQKRKVKNRQETMGSGEM